MNNLYESIPLKKAVLLLGFIFLWSVSAQANPFSLGQDGDTIPLYSNGVVRKSIYPQTTAGRSNFYNFLWGEHYRDLYTTPIAVQPANLNNLYGGLKVERQIPEEFALLLRNNQDQDYLLKIVGGYSTFLQSGFFRDVYNHREFKKTYLDEFIKDAYTITHPYSFILADRMADRLALSSFDPKIYYLPQNSVNDTISDGTRIDDRMVSIYDLKAYADNPVIIQTDTLLTKIKEDKTIKIDEEVYIRERLFDMLVGDWNKGNENWRWQEQTREDSVVTLSPVIVDRQSAFTKVDGFFFKGILGMFGLKSVTNYDYRYGELKKVNGMSYSLDVALAGQADRQMWLEQAKYIKQNLTNEVIDEIFQLLPDEIKGEYADNIKSKLKMRRDNLEVIASHYYDILQETPVIVGTNEKDSFVINRTGDKQLQVQIFNKQDRLVFEKLYDRKTKEIWIYGLEGDDRFEVSGDSRKTIPMILIGGKGENNYNIENGKKLTIYEYKSHDSNTDTLSGAKMIETDIEKVHEYDFNKLKYSTLDFTPWGVYDSDLGLYLGVYLSKTMYGFKRSPYSYRHRIGYNYLNGFTYQGLFPALDEKKIFTIEAFIGTPNNFINFFGYGNETDGYKDEKRKYNRVNISKYSIAPSFIYKFDEEHKITAQASVDLYDIRNSEDRFVNDVYDENDRFFETKAFADINLSYQITRKLFNFMPKVDFSLTGGFQMNVKETNWNFPYLKSELGIDFAINDRIALATEFNGIVLFSDRYEFYQAASAELRGYRGNRFIGRQAYYQHTDLRFDLGRLENPVTPLVYGVFAGFDYGRVWYPNEYSEKWHTSYGGGFWITLFKKYTGKFSLFGSKDGTRFSFGLGLGF